MLFYSDCSILLSLELVTFSNQLHFKRGSITIYVWFETNLPY